MIETPADPTCVVKSGEEVVILSGDVFKLPNGATTATLENCKFESGAMISFNYVETEDKPKRKLKPVVTEEITEEVATLSDAPEETTAVVTPETANAGTTATEQTVKTRTKSNNQISIIAIVAAAIAGIAALLPSSQSSGLSTQQREQERKKCHGNADRIKSIISEAESETSKINFEISTPKELYAKIDATILEVNVLTKLVRS